MADDVDVAGQPAEQAAEGTPPEPQIMVGGLFGVVGLAYRTAARHLVLLLASHRRVLRLFPCGPDGCGGNGPVDTAPIVERNGDSGASAAMTTTGDGIVIAALRLDDSGDRSEVRLIHCADMRCQKPRAVTVDRLGWTTFDRHSSPLAVAVRRDGRPVVAVAEEETGAVTMIGCDRPECRHPRLTRPVPPPAHSPSANDILDDLLLDGVKLVIPRDDRPVLAYTDPGTGAARLVRCRTPDCAAADGTALTGPGLWHTRPAIALDGDRPLVATYDLRRKAAVLIDCQDLGCTHRRSVVLGALKKGPGYLDLVVGGDRRPRVLWGDQSPDPFGDAGPLHLTTCARPRCGG